MNQNHANRSGGKPRATREYQPANRPQYNTGTGAERGRGSHVNYIGVGPWPDPVIAFCVRATDERTSPAVNAAAREVTRRLLAALADRRSTLEVAARRPRRLARLR